MSNSDPDEDPDEDPPTPINKEGYYIVIDKRERAITPFFKKTQTLYNIPYSIEHMTVGDIAICYRGHILIIIERKTWQDLASSMKDGRKANIEKLKALRETSKCQIAYLIEGNAFPKPTKKFCRIPHKNLRAHLDHLAIRDAVHMLYAKTCADTVHRIFELTRNYSTITPSLTTPIDLTFTQPHPSEETPTIEEKTGGNEESLRTKHTPSDQLIISNMWCACKNITHNNVNTFMTQFKLKDLLLGTITKNDIAALKYPSGTTIGVARATTILKSVASHQTHAKILAAIPSITLTTAKKILETITISDLLSPNNEQTTTLLANIKKTEKMKIGTVSAKKIIKFISL